MCASQAKQILSIRRADDGKVNIDFNKDALVEIIKCVQELPVIPITIVGKSRNGKSFLMNYILRYYQSIESCHHSTNSWMAAQLENEFYTAGGMEAVTEGIFAWDHPFVVEINKRKCAVLLLDVMGTEDLQNDVSLAQSLYALSCMTSSMVIMNVKENIDRNTLEMMDFTLKLATNYQQMCADQAKNAKPFQSISCLIRDWCCIKNASLGYHAGMSVWNSTKLNKVLTKDLKTIETCFQSVVSYLLPHPGEKISRGDFESTNDLSGDIPNSEFFTHLKGFIETILCLKKLSPLQRNGSLKNGKEYVVYLESCFNMINSDDFRITSPIEVVAESVEADAVEESLKVFHKNMSKYCSNKVLTDEDIREQYEQCCLPLVKKHFQDCLSKFPPSPKREKYDEKLNDRLNDVFKTYTADNIILKEQRLDQMKKEIAQYIETYQAEMQKHIKPQSVYFEEFDVIHQRALGEPLRKFNETLSSYEKCLHKECKKIFDDQIELKHLTFQSINHENHAREIKISQKFEAALTAAKTHLKSGIQEMISGKGYLTPEEFQNIIETVWKTTHEDFENLLGPFCLTDLTEEQKYKYKTALKDIVDEMANSNQQKVNWKKVGKVAGLAACGTAFTIGGGVGVGAIAEITLVSALGISCVFGAASCVCLASAVNLAYKKDCFKKATSCIQAITQWKKKIE